MPKIGLIGFGYWGSIISQILLRQGYDIDIIFSNKKILTNFPECRQILPSSQLSFENIHSLTHLFVLTGPPYHHHILRKLDKLSQKCDLPLIWLEKPFLTSTLQASYTPLVQKKIYLDYPYSRKNAEFAFLQSVNDCQYDSNVEINIFSKHDIHRDFGVVFDFVPHIVSLMSFFVKDFDSLSYFNWSIDEMCFLCPESSVKRSSIVYSFEALSDLNGNKYLIRFGINNPRPSFVVFNARTHRICNADSSSDQHKIARIMHLSDAFKSPVDQNIRRFLSTDPINLIDSSDAAFHDLIYKISVNADLEFSKLR